MRDENGNVAGIYPQAFELRADEESLSLSWLEFFKKTHSENIEDSVNEFRAMPYEVHGKSGFGIANVGNLCQVCAQSNHPKVKVLYDGDRKKSNVNSHSSLRNTSNDNELLQNLATKAFSTVVIAETVALPKK